MMMQRRLHWTRVLQRLALVTAPISASARLLAILTLGCALSFGQMHKVAKPEQVVRSVGVYEWTGDMAKPTASRLIPVSLFIDDHLEDAGVYLSRPVPFALDTGTVYEVEQAGMPKGTVNLEFARHLIPRSESGDGPAKGGAVLPGETSTNYDDGWFGYGTFQPPPRPRPVVLKKPSKATVATKPKAADDSDRPTFARRSSEGSGDPGHTSATTSTSAPGSPADASSTADAPSDDPNRPHLTRKTGGTTGDPTASGGDATAPAKTTQPPAPATDSTSNPSTSPSASQPAPATVSNGGTPPSDSTDEDPDRPQFAKRPGAAPAGSSTTTASGQTTGGTSSSPAGSQASGQTGSVPANDPDRPTLKKRTPAEANQARKQSEQSNVQGATASLNDDPDRPKLGRGKPAHPETASGLQTLKGLPSELHQMVAVSDAKTRESHDFALAWEDDAERVAILTQMQALARTQVAVYDASQTAAIRAQVAASDAQAVQNAQASKATGAATKAAGSSGKRAGSANQAASTASSSTAVNGKSAAARRRAAAARTAAVPLVLEEEFLKGYTLSYGGAATYIYTAETAGSGVAKRYVTIVAQRDALGALKPAIESVTDVAHLDRTPRMRLVDVVDAEASNRASVLFELRGANERAFALYRVIAAHAEQTFLTGTTQ